MSSQQDLAKIVAANAVYRTRIIDLLKRERPKEVHELLHPRDVTLPRFATITWSYFDFPMWLSRFDGNNLRGLQVNIDSYRYQRDAYLEETRTEMRKLTVRLIGRALLREIDDNGHVLILPYLDFDRYPTQLFLGGYGINAYHTVGTAVGRALSRASESIIFFSPHMWNRAGKPGTSGDTSPGSAADEVLFHELVHAMRRQAGVSTSNTRKVSAGWDNLEEYTAVVLTNIYMAENHKRLLRSGHGRSVLRSPSAFLLNPDNIRPTPLELMDILKVDHPQLFRTVADIDASRAWWNPIRDAAGPSKTGKPAHEPIHAGS
jgi:hypothetical protein